VAFAQLTAALESSQYTDAERKALESLQTLRKAIDEQAAGQPNAGLFETGQVCGAQKSLPKDFKYLGSYLIGKWSVAAARGGLARCGESSEQNVSAPCQSAGDAVDAIPIEADQIRYRASPHNAAASYYLVEATKRKPDFSPAYEQLYQHHRLSGHWADALLTADKLVEIMPRCAEALAMRAECYQVLGQPGSAREDLKAATKLSPANGRLHFRLANLLVESGDYAEAIKSYEEALLCNAPDLYDALHFHLGIAYRRAGVIEKANTAFTTAKALGWPAEMCDSQIAACRQQAVPGTSSGEPRTTTSAPVAGLGDARPRGAGLPTTASLASEVRAHVHEPVVYVTKSGTKYHCEHCQHLRHGKRPIPLSEAARLYEPCAHCRPPVPGSGKPVSANVAVSQRAAPHE
jgi:tetratricopeptide (TPR) repeat protein